MTDPALAALLCSLHESPLAGGAGGLPENADGVSRMAARTRPSPLQKLVNYGPLHRLPFLGRLSPRHFLDCRTVKEGEHVYAVCGACILFRSKAFQEAEGFDESTFLYEEELIMSERLKRVGSFFVLSKGCTYYHAEARSTDRMPYKRRLHFIESEQYLLSAYYRWNLALRLAFRVWRYVEWTIYALTWSLRRKRGGAEYENWPGSGPLRQAATEMAVRRRH